MGPHHLCFGVEIDDQVIDMQLAWERRLTVYVILVLG